MSKQITFDKVDLLGVEIDVIAISEAIEVIIARSAPTEPVGYVVKPYVEFLDQSYHNLEIQTILNNADLAIADGIALIWAAAFLYAGPRSTWRLWITLTKIILAPQDLCWPLTERAAGINFTWPLLEAAAHHQRSVALIGTPRGSTINHTAQVLHERLPQLTITCHDGTDPNARDGRQSTSWINQLAWQLRDSRPDIILLGLGFPRQEFVAAALAEQLDHGIIIGEGGTFDYTTFGGRQPKAPGLFQRLGLEWLWRLCQEPSRWRRQLAIPRFIWRIWRGRSR